MRDIVVLELIISAILFFAIARPFIKGFQGIEGIAALPAIALAISVAVFPAYGFRPEFVPLFLLAFFMFLGSIPRFVDVFRRLKTDDYGERSFGRLVIGTLFLFLAAGFAIAFAPVTERSGTESPGDRDIVIRDEVRGAALSMRYYDDVSGQDHGEQRKPILLVFPPLSGSIPVTDTLCGALSRRGFSVVAFARIGVDFPAPLPGGKRAYPRIDAAARSALAFLWGTRFAYAAKVGSTIERERAEDISYAVKYARIAAQRGNAPFEDADPERIFVVGFGAGGAAATEYAASSAAQISAAVSIEGPILAALQGEAPAQPVVSDARTNPFEAWIEGSLERLGLKGIAGIDTVPAPTVPMLFLASDRVREPTGRDGRYATIIRALRTAEVPCALVSVEGAGPFEYTDAGSEYPVYAAMKPSLSGRSRDRRFYVERTVDLIANFAFKILAASGNGQIFRGASLGSDVKVEYNRSWTSSGVGDILRP